MNKKNAGFSLVELIVVIAIMAVLVGVLAPAYLRYVEKSRKSADATAVDEMLKAADAVASDTTIDITGNFTITKSGNDLLMKVGTATPATPATPEPEGSAGYLLASVDVYAEETKTAESEWWTIAGVDDGKYTLRSKEFKTTTGESVATGTYNATEGSVVWTSKGALFKAMTDYSGDIAKKIGFDTSASK